MLLWQEYTFNPALSPDDHLKLFEKQVMNVTRPANRKGQPPNLVYKVCRAE